MMRAPVDMGKPGGAYLIHFCQRIAHLFVIQRCNTLMEDRIGKLFVFQGFESQNLRGNRRERRKNPDLDSMEIT